jgi:citrate lyase subunit alpha/citrate CoA-transferase
LLEAGLFKNLTDTQSFDMNAIDSIAKSNLHMEISAAQYASPFNKGCTVNKLDYVVLSALEIDVDFNVNVITGSDGVIRGASGGHSDTAAGAKCAIIVAPLVRGRIPTVVDSVQTVITPGETIDVFVCEYGIAVNPRRTDLAQQLTKNGIELKSIDELRDLAYSYTGKPKAIDYEDEVVALIEYRDGSIIDVVRKVK